MPGTEAGAGTRLVAGRYQLTAELGRGGMGVVWLAEDQLVGRQVAVKELRPPPGLAGTERDSYRRRALAEARSAARIDHPGAVTLYDVLPASDGDDAVYLIMELVAGPTLAQLIGQQGRLPEATVAAFGVQLADVLAAAHALGVVHRDIKPANILIAAGGQVKLTDFGIAHTIGDLRLTRSGILGTQAYLAPELFESAPITPAADVWSLGATLYAAAEGRGPFDRDTTGATLRAILIDDLPAPGCSPALAGALTGMLQRDPGRRASTAQARAALHAAAQAAPPPETAPHAPGADGPPTTTTPTQTTPAPGADGGPAASPAPPRWAQLPTTRSPAPPPGAPPPGPEPQPPPRRPRLPRRTAIIAGTITAAMLAAAAITGGILATTHHTPQPPAINNLPGSHLIATLTDPGLGWDPGFNAAFSPNGKTLATGGGDNGQVYLWSTASRSITATLTDPDTQGVGSVAFSPDSKTLATADGNGHIYLWSTAEHRITATLTDPDTQGVGSVAFSPDGKTLATATGTLARRTYHIYLWSTASRTIIATLTEPYSSYSVNSLAFSPDGKTLATADETGSTYLWSTATHRITATLADPEGPIEVAEGVSRAAFSPDGKTLATADLDGSTYLWSTATHRITATLTDPNSNGVNSVGFSPDGKTLVTTDDRRSKGSIGFLWDIATQSLIGTVSDPGGYGREERDAAFSPDGKTLATGDDDGSAYLWRVLAGG